MSVFEKISNGEYENPHPCPPRSGYQSDNEHFQAWREWKAETQRLKVVFKTDLLEELEISNHPKADALFRIASNFGHYSNFHEVQSHAERLIELLE